MKKLRQKIIRWLFKEEIQKLKLSQKEWDKMLNIQRQIRDDLYYQSKRLYGMIGNIDIAIDIDLEKYGKSWAIIAIKGQKTDYIKFCDLGDIGIQQLHEFLRYYEKPQVTIDLPNFLQKNKFFEL